MPWSPAGNAWRGLDRVDQAFAQTLVDDVERKTKFRAGRSHEARAGGARYCKRDLDGARNRDSELLRGDSDEFKDPYSEVRDAPLDALSRRHDTWDVVLEQHVVDPFGGDAKCKCCSTNAIRANHE